MKPPDSSRFIIRKAVSWTGVAKRAVLESFPQPKSSALKGNFNQSVTIVNSRIEGKNLSEDSRAFVYSLMYSSVITCFAAWIFWIVLWRGSSNRSLTKQETEARTKAFPVKFLPSGGWNLSRESTGNCKQMFVWGGRRRAFTLAYMIRMSVTNIKLQTQGFVK